MDNIDGLLPIGFGIVCILLINFFVVAKFSFARLRKEHVEDMEILEEKDRKFLLQLYQNPEYFLNTTQFLILFFVLALAGTGTYVFDTIIDDIMIVFNIHGTWVHHVLDVVLLLFISLIVLIFGEIVPKALGLSFPTKYVNTYSRIVVGAGRLVYPFIWIGSKISNRILKFYKTKYLTELDLVYTEDEIRMMISRSHEEGQLDQVESELIDNVFNFVERMAKEVMVPRQDVNCIFVEDGYDEAMKVIRSTAHTRYPLCVEDKDHIIGLVHIKDLMERPNQAKKDLRNVKRDILTVPEVMKLSTLLQYMRTRRIYQAVVVDEYGGMVGLVGLEDIIEELVGDIQDEHESHLPATMTYADGSFEFDGKVLVDEVAEIMDIDIEDSDSDTIGGYVFGLLERTPIVGDTVEAYGYSFEVIQMQGYRISRVRVVPVPVEEAVNEDDQQES